MSVSLFWTTPGQSAPPEPEGTDPGKALGPGAEPADAALTRPPGLLGDFADYVYASASMPVLEVAVVAALGLVAGIAGRQWNTGGDPAGLNLYLVLLGKTGIGKEAGQRAIARLLSHVRRQVPSIDAFVGPSAFASG